VDAQGNELVSHKDKELLIWQTFKDRLGTSDFSLINSELHLLSNTATDLTAIVVPFNRNEIDAVVKALPTDKAPRSDGFNTDFLKKCWSLICQDFYNLFQAFFEE
jgi:hypothetical protein